MHTKIARIIKSCLQRSRCNFEPSDRAAGAISNRNFQLCKWQAILSCQVKCQNAWKWHHNMCELTHGRSPEVLGEVPHLWVRSPTLAGGNPPFSESPAMKVQRNSRRPSDAAAPQFLVMPHANHIMLSLSR